MNAPDPNSADVVAQAAREKADRALRTARRSLKDGDADGAINRAYYAAFYMAVAALALVGEAPKTHTGTHNRFWQRFVMTGSFSKELGGLLSYAQQQRESADYDVISVHDTAAAADLLRDVERFCDAATNLLNDLSKRDAST